MTAPDDGARGVLRAGLVEFTSPAVFERETESVVSQGVLWISGSALPAPLEEFEFKLRIPGGPLVPMAGKIILQQQASALVELRLGRDELISALKDLHFPERRKERRRLPRYERRLPAALGKVACATYDVSPSGLCLAIAQPLAVGSIVQGSVSVDGKALAFSAEVRWAFKPAADERQPGRVGLRLLSIAPEYYALFREPRPSSSPPPRAPVAPAPAAAPATPRPPAAAVAPTTPRPPTGSTPLPPGPVEAGSSRRQRRQLPRTRKRFKVKIGNTTGFTFDVSPRGMGVELLKTFQPGLIVEGKIFMGDKELPFTAQVRWARAGLPAIGVRARVGFLFQSIPNDFFELFTNPTP